MELTVKLFVSVFWYSVYLPQQNYIGLPALSSVIKCGYYKLDSLSAGFSCEHGSEPLAFTDWREFE
jgi:hypothetical protein